MNPSPHLFAKATRAFTFIELLIVLAVFATLAFMLMPRMGPQHISRAARINCVNNLKQVGLARARPLNFGLMTIKKSSPCRSQ